MKKILFSFQLCIIFIFLLFSEKLPAQPDTLSFLHISDLHLIFNLDVYQPDLAQNRKHYSKGIRPLEQFLREMPDKTNSSLVVATGDLIDFFEGETGDSGMLDFQAEQFSRLISDSPVPVFLTLGNHDIVTYMWEDTLRTATQKGAGRARAAWTRASPCFYEGPFYSRVFNVDKTTYRLIFLDNGYNSIRQGGSGTIPYIDKAQLHWLEGQLQESQADIEIVLMHIPFQEGSLQANNQNELYSALVKNSSAKLVLNGHNHKNAVRNFPSADEKMMVQVQTGAFAQSADNWRLISLTGNNILVSFPGRTKTELTIPVR